MHNTTGETQDVLLLALLISQALNTLSSLPPSLRASVQNTILMLKDTPNARITLP